MAESVDPYPPQFQPYSERLAPPATPPDPHASRVPWRAIFGLLSEVVGLILIGFVLFLAWWPLPLALLGAILIWIPNRR